MTEKTYTFAWPDRIDAKVAEFEERLQRLESAGEQRRERIGELALALHIVRRTLDEMLLTLAKIEAALSTRDAAGRPGEDL